MSDIAIRVENLGKQYKIGRLQKRNDTLRDAIAGTWRRTASRNVQTLERDNEQFIWALRDVSFEVKRGEVVGIIGRNGAGKSTLLKILSRITEPTTGTIDIYGRVGSLLEVGTGFHPELTGRENIFLNGAILGMRKAEIGKKFDEIVAFAEVEKFIDTPVKRYSSGMYVRLAFAVAAFMEPEILVIDEVLAVGDAAFQKKCLGKMEDVAHEGRTVLFVSHSMDKILRLCRTACFLNSGKLVQYDETNKVVRNYMSDSSQSTSHRKWSVGKFPSNGAVRLIEVYAHDEQKNKKESFDVTEIIGITLKYEVLSSGYVLRPAFNFFNEAGVNIFDTHDTGNEWRREIREKGLYSSTVWIPSNFLAEGLVIVGAAIVTPDPFSIHIHERDVIAFTVTDRLSPESARGDYVGSFPGVVRPFLKWESSYYLPNQYITQRSFEE